MSIDAKRRLTGAAFVALLLLSVFWPEPVIDVNRLCCNAALAVDDLSFLGREAPSWAVFFWCLVGLFALALMHPSGESRDYALPRLRFWWKPLLAIVPAAFVVFLVWRFCHAPATAWAARIPAATI